MRAVILAFFLVSLASCKKKKMEPLLQGDTPDPKPHTDVAPAPINDLFIVIKVRPYGHKDMLGLAVVEDGTRERSTLIVPSAMGLKNGDVVRLQQVCYRANEKYSSEKTLTVRDACTDIVVPYVPPTAEASQK